MNRHSHDLARQLYARPEASAMIARLPDLGEALRTSAIDLAKDPTLPRIDEMLARIKGAENSLMHLRRKLKQEAQRD